MSRPSPLKGKTVWMRYANELEAQLEVRERTSQFHKSNHLAAEKQLEEHDAAWEEGIRYEQYIALEAIGEKKDG